MLLKNKFAKYVIGLINHVKSIPLLTYFLGLFTMIGVILIYINHGCSEYLLRTGIALEYSFTVYEGCVRGFLLGLVNFIAIIIATDQVIQTKPAAQRLAKKFGKIVFLGENANKWEIYAAVAAVLNVSIYALVNVVGMILTPGILQPGSFLLQFGFGSVVAISSWIYISFYLYPLDESVSIEKLKIEHKTWLEICRQFITIASLTASGFVIYGVVNWIILTPQDIALTREYSLNLFSLALVAAYIYVGVFLGMVFPIFIQLGKIREKIGKLDKQVSEHHPI
jgi:hypothetical protein